MKRDELLMKLRLDFNNYIRKDYVKDKCEKCRSNENLHVHHIITFKSQFEHILELMNISSKEEFNDNEVELIRLAMFGSQYKHNHYITLCDKCHIDKHLELKYNSKMRRKDIYNSYLNGSLKLTLNKEYLNKWISLEEFINIMNSFNIKDLKGRLIGKRTFVKILKNSKYQIKTKRKTLNKIKETYYYITK